jgi:septum formation protein
LADRSAAPLAGGGARRLVLASRSPQRQAILEQLGVTFSVVVPEVTERESGPPEEVALDNARRKATAVAERATDALVLGVDTVVWCEGRLYGKPADRDEAEMTLRALAGRAHAVISGLCLVEDGGARTAAATTTVRFRPLDEPVLRWYLDSDEWRERAGGYAIQGRGAALVATIDGDYLNVVGLPVTTLLDLEPRLLSP